MSAVGEVITYTVVAHNDGNVTLGNVFIQDPMAGLTNWTCGDKSGPVSLAPGETKTCTANYTVTQAGLNRGTIVNTARESSTGPNAEAFPDETATETIEVTQNPGITVEKVADQTSFSEADQVVNYTLTVRNTGNVALTDVQVDDPMIAADMTCVPAIGSRLEAGDTMTCVGPHAITQAEMDAGFVDNAVEVSGLAPDGLTRPLDSDDLVISGERDPELSLTKQPDRQSVDDDGQIITYTFTVTNTGNVTMEDVTVTDPLTGLVITDPLPGLVQTGCDVRELDPGKPPPVTASTSPSIPTWTTARSPTRPMRT